MKKYYALLEERHGRMLEFQDQIKPFTPTIRELVDLWGVRSTSAAAYILERLVDHGLVITRSHGDVKDSYYAIPAGKFVSDANRV